MNIVFIIIAILGAAFVLLFAIGVADQILKVTHGYNNNSSYNKMMLFIVTIVTIIILIILSNGEG